MMTSDVRDETRIRVVAICGSLRGLSYTRMALSVALRGARQVGAETALIDLRGYDLVFREAPPPPGGMPTDVSRLRREVAAAHGIILGTPEYHASFSGVLKNALDLMGFEEFEGKMVGLVGVSGGRMGAADALGGLRSIGRSLHAWVIPEQVAIPEVWKAFGEDGSVKDTRYEALLLEVGKQVARFAYLHNSEHVREFLRLWEGAPPNPGGGPTPHRSP